MSATENPTPHSTDLRVRFYELDPYGHVNHSVYIQFFESARVVMLGEVGFGLDSMLTDDMALVVIRLSTKFVTPALLNEQLTIETGVIEMGRVRSTWAQRIVRGPDTIATQVIEFATTSREGRPRRTPEGLGTAMEQFRVGDDWLGGHDPR